MSCCKHYNNFYLTVPDVLAMLCLITVFPRIDRARSINFSLSKLHAIIEGALYSRGVLYFESALAEQIDAILACVNLWSRLCTRVHYYILRGVFEGALYFTTH